MHVCILTKVWYQKWGDWYTHCATEGQPCFYVTMQKGQAKTRSQMDINTCTDAYTHFEQGVRTEMGDIQTNSTTQGCPCFHVTVLRMWS